MAEEPQVFEKNPLVEEVEPGEYLVAPPRTVE